MIVDHSWGVKSPPAASQACQAVRRALREAGVLRWGDIHLIWTSKNRIRALNRRFRSVDRATDVIAFRSEARRLSGDLFIATAQARENARFFGASFNEEIVRLAAHGALHLAGHTDYTPRPRARMWRHQERVVKHFFPHP